jgi:AcrR family transcriptional regulator
MEAGMATYTSSETTKTKMINAAGELAAEVGIDNVSTRAVAERSGENIGSIHYHFGSKEGFFEAVVRDAMAGCVDKKFRYAMDELSEESTPEEFSQALRTVVAGEVTNLFRSNRPDWHAQVIYQLLQRDDVLSDIFKVKVMDPDTNSISRFFRLLNQEFTNDDIFLHMIALKMPIFVHAHYKKNFLKQLGVKEYSEDYLQKMEDLLVKQAQLLLGLPQV